MSILGNCNGDFNARNKKRDNINCSPETVLLLFRTKSYSIVKSNQILYMYVLWVCLIICVFKSRPAYKLIHT